MKDRPTFTTVTLRSIFHSRFSTHPLRHTFLAQVFILLTPFNLPAQEDVDHAVIARIKEEGFQHSQVMSTLSYLTDVHGPRLSGSPAYYEAAQWAKAEMESWDLSNVRFDQLTEELRGWSAQSYSMTIIKPHYETLFAYPYAWTSGTKGTVTGVPFIMDGEHWQIDSLARYSGKLEGRIIFFDKSREYGPRFDAFARRFTDDDLESAVALIDPAMESKIEGETTKTVTEAIESWADWRQKETEVEQFFLDEGASAIVFPSSFNHGIIRVGGKYFDAIGEIKPVAQFVISNEQFGRIARRAEKGIETEIELHLEAQFHEDPRYRINVLAEIPGVDRSLKSEIVMAGAHFDTWHTGTGATDNSAGVAVMMEALRILKSIGIKPKRTLRLGLWYGEEQAYWGSRDYVDKYIGDIFTGESKSEKKKMSAYLNVDNGSGKIRGIYLQGNEAVRPIFSDLLEPFHYLDANVLTVQNTSGTDHLIFDASNIPAFQFIQDPLNYGTVTHHSNMDVADYVIEDDMKHNAVIVASFLYHLAMRDEMLPRKTVK
ncbi:MAG: M20/M25/M40 family metallo-hydrolase [Planctomycetota bacterium]|nr:MAG: M20/M25/M40 family metallo-hydrolase [Planctomycetota bacterium]